MSSDRDRAHRGAILPTERAKPAKRCSTCGVDGAVLEDAAFCTRCGAPVLRRAAADVSIGALVGGRYRIVGLVGEGGMGTVYAAEQALGTEVRKVAVKVLRKDSATTPEVLQRFRRECGTASKLVHPNAVAIHDFGTTDSGELYIAMDLVAGRPLRELVTAGGMSPARVSALLGQICDVLDEAHALGIVHRDLKPDNILVVTDRRGRETIKILDFGIALPGLRADGRVRTRLTLMGTIMGTPPYMSPEQFLGADVDARSDVYSLGILAYELLAGRTPFYATELIAWASFHLTAAPPSLPDTAAGIVVPAALRLAIARALAKEPGQRPQTAGAFYAELSREASSPARLSSTLLASPSPSPSPSPVARAAAAPAAAPAAASALVPVPETDDACELAFTDVPTHRPTTRGPSRGRVALIALALAVGGALAVTVMVRAPHAPIGLTPTEVAPAAAASSAPPTTIASYDLPVTTPLRSTAPSISESAPPPPPAIRARVSSCLAIATSTDCATIAALKPRCVGSDPFSSSAQARCAGMCPALCAAPPRRR